jgi:hypothetical protein
MMTITITLPRETEERLRAQAEATGKNFGAIVIETVEARLSFSQRSLREFLAPAHADFQRSGRTKPGLDTLPEESRDTARKERMSAPGTPV